MVTEVTAAKQLRGKSEELTAIERGRGLLEAWRALKPENFFTADRNLQRVLTQYLTESEYDALVPRLRALGRDCAQVLDPAAAENDRREHHPRLARYDGLGQRVEAVDFHPSYDVAGRVAYGCGIMGLQAKPGHTREQFGFFYLLNQCGEMGHNCPLACTAGLIKVLQRLAPPELRERYLPKLFDPHYETRWHGAQFLTEVQGGSDVGANACRARPAGDGSWRLTGEKWFCSNVTADLSLVTARPEGAPPGTRGLGLFLVPRRLEDGQPNGVAIRRLKDKIGTRTLATAELDFQDAVAYAMGPLDQGFKHMVSLVLDTSRLFNSCCCAGFLRRAWVEAAAFAQLREAFGHRILDYPLVQEALALIKVDLYATVASTFRLAHLLDRSEAERADELERAALRLGVNFNKYWTSLQATRGTHRAVEVLGGNGAIEEFSILPRLYRDALVLESWEGAHNVLCAQVWRDATERGLAEPLWRHFERELGALSRPELETERARMEGWIVQQRRRFERLVAQGEVHAQAHLRRWIEGVAQTFQALCWLQELNGESDKAFFEDKREAWGLFADLHLEPGYDPLSDPDYPARLRRLSAPEERVA